MKLLQSRVTRVVAGTMVGFALAGVAVTAITGNTQADSDHLLASEKAWAQAPVDRDADRMAGYMADEYVELVWETATQTAPAHWRAIQKKEWVEAVRRGTDVYKSVELRNLTVHLQGSNLAVVTGEYSQTGTSDGKDNSATGIYANTWVKRNGRWVVIHGVFP